MPAQLHSIVLGIVLCGSTAAAEPPARAIALSFDDAPRSDSAYFSGAERTNRLLAALKNAGVSQAAFFCNTVQLDAAGSARLNAYAAAGHLIANHSHSHLDLHRVGVPEFLADVLRADGILRTFPNFRSWLRFPYLHEGKTLAVRDEVRVELARMDYRAGYVTIDNYDWHMDALFQDAVKAHKSVDLDRLRDAYVELLTQGVEFYDGVAREKLGRSPRHVLLLHENDLAALFVADLVQNLRDAGWQIVSAEEAYADPIAATEPQTLRLGQGRTMALAIDRGYDGAARKWEDEAEIEAELGRRGVWK